MSARRIRFLIWSFLEVSFPYSYSSGWIPHWIRNETSLINYSLHKLQSWYNSLRKEFKFKVILSISSCSIRALIVVGLYTFKISMCKLEELSKFLEYLSNMLEISSQLIWKIPVTYWKFPVGSKMNLAFFDTLLTFKNSEKNKLSLFHVILPIFHNFWKLLTCQKGTNSFFSLLEISSKLLEYSRLTDYGYVYSWVQKYSYVYS